MRECPSPWPASSMSASRTLAPDPSPSADLSPLAGAPALHSMPMTRSDGARIFLFFLLLSYVGLGSPPLLQRDAQARSGGTMICAEPQRRWLVGTPIINLLSEAAVRQSAVDSVRLRLFTTTTTTSATQPSCLMSA
eukprot:366188-Chlamydomonas_euryale.AAC.7